MRPSGTRCSAVPLAAQPAATPRLSQVPGGSKRAVAPHTTPSSCQSGGLQCTLPPRAWKEVCGAAHDDEGRILLPLTAVPSGYASCIPQRAACGWAVGEAVCRAGLFVFRGSRFVKVEQGSIGGTGTLEVRGAPPPDHQACTANLPRCTANLPACTLNLAWPGWQGLQAPCRPAQPPT